MSAVATAIVVAGGVGYLGSQQASGRAADAQRDASAASAATQRYMYDQTREDNRQAREIGLGALGSMNTNINHFTDTFDQNDFQKDPGYQFRMDEASKAIENSASARGMLNSGRTLKDLTRFSQDYASNEYNNAYNRFNADRDQAWNKLAGLAGVGQTATNQISNSGMNYANQVSANQTAMANANAAYHIGQGNNLNNFMNQLGTSGAIYFGGRK